MSLHLLLLVHHQQSGEKLSRRKSKQPLQHQSRRLLLLRSPKLSSESNRLFKFLLPHPGQVQEPSPPHLLLWQFLNLVLHRQRHWQPLQERLRPVFQVLQAHLLQVFFRHPLPLVQDHLHPLPRRPQPDLSFDHPSGKNGRYR